MAQRSAFAPTLPLQAFRRAKLAKLGAFAIYILKPPSLP